MFRTALICLGAIPTPPTTCLSIIRSFSFVEESHTKSHFFWKQLHKPIGKRKRATRNNYTAWFSLLQSLWDTARAEIRLKEAISFPVSASHFHLQNSNFRGVVKCLYGTCQSQLSQIKLLHVLSSSVSL